MRVSKKRIHCRFLILILIDKFVALITIAALAPLRSPDFLASYQHCYVSSPCSVTLTSSYVELAGLPVASIEFKSFLHPRSVLPFTLTSNAFDCICSVFLSFSPMFSRSFYSVCEFISSPPPGRQPPIVVTSHLFRAPGQSLERL